MGHLLTKPISEFDKRIMKIAAGVCLSASILMLIATIALTVMGHLEVQATGRTSSRSIFNGRSRNNAIVGVCSELSATENVCQNEYKLTTGDGALFPAGRYLNGTMLTTDQENSNTIAFVPVPSEKRRRAYYMIDVNTKLAFACGVPNDQSDIGGTCEFIEDLSSSSHLTEWEFHETKLSNFRLFRLVARPGVRCSSANCQLAEQFQYYLSCDETTSENFCSLFVEKQATSLVFDLEKQ